MRCKQAGSRQTAATATPKEANLDLTELDGPEMPVGTAMVCEYTIHPDLHLK